MRYRLKDIRGHFWNVSEGNTVHHVLGAISRWCCPLCGETFTYWPEFAIPYKRYTRQEIEERVRRYVEDEARTYEEAASENGRPIIHEVGPGGPPVRMAPPVRGMKDEPLPSSLARSTVWRWVGILGKQEAELREAMAIVSRMDPNVELHRVVLVIRPAKFRLPEREGMIKTAAWFLRVLARIRGPPAP